MNRHQRRKQAAQKGRITRPNASNNTAAEIAQAFEAAINEAHEAGRQERENEINATTLYSDGMIVFLMDAVETWRLHCHTIDVMVKAELSDRQLKTVIDLELRNEIESSYKAIKKAWQAQSDLVEQLSGVGLTDLDTLRPDLEAATEARIQAIDELYSDPGSTTAIKALQPVNVSIVDFINPVKMGRVSLEEKADYVTLEAIRYAREGKSPNWIQRQLIYELDSGKASPEHWSSLQMLKESGDPEQLIKRRIKRAVNG